MPLYAFSLRGLDDEDIHLEAQRFDDDLAARIEAEASARELGSELHGGAHYAGSWYEVVNEQGRCVAVVPISPCAHPSAPGIAGGLPPMTITACENTIH